MIKIFITFFIFFNIALFSNEENSDKNNYKKHYLDVTIFGGASLANSYELQIGGNWGSSFGYQYAFNKFFAFGPGISFIGIVLNNITHDFNKQPTMFGSITFEPGGAFMFLFMFGDLINNKIALLYDIGVGWFFSSKIGINLKGFIFKIGYHSTYFFYHHSILLEFGYKLNFGKIPLNN